MDYVQYEQRQGIGIVTFHGPRNLNALSRERIREVDAFFCSLEDRLERTAGSTGGNVYLRALILTGHGKAFIAGADIKEMRAMTSAEAAAFCEDGYRLMQRIERFPVPVIAAVNGHALGGGMETALAADYIYAGSDAKFGLPEVTLGVMPGFGGVRRLSLRIGIARAKELVYSGRVIDADHAVTLGIANRKVDGGDLMDAAMEAALGIERAAPGAVRAAKRHFGTCGCRSSEELLETEKLRFGALFDGPEPAEGMQAFLDKRKPQWT